MRQTKYEYSNVQNGTLNVVRIMATSVLFLVGTIRYSAYVLFELLGLFTGRSEIVNIFNNIMAQSGDRGNRNHNDTGDPDHRARFCLHCGFRSGGHRFPGRARNGFTVRILWGRRQESTDQRCHTNI